MKRFGALVLFVLGLAVAGFFSGAVIADTTSTSTASSTTAAATTTAVTTTTVAPVNTLPAGVRVAGVRVGGLAPLEAVAAVQSVYAKPLAVIVDRSRLELDPRTYASAYIATAVAKARIAQPGSDVQLVVSPRGASIRSFAAKVVARFARPARDASLTFKGLHPVVTTDRPGRSLDGTVLVQRIAVALASNSRLPVRVHTKLVAPKVSAKTTYAHVIVISRAANRLYLYAGDKLQRSFPVATGQAIYPTPVGTFHIVVMQRNPWWYPPTYDSWAKGLEPVPPGPDNPLGTRWMGLSVPGVGIHGTDEPTSIGYSESHGCVRMQVPDAEWLFNHVTVGTTVHIV